MRTLPMRVIQIARRLQFHTKLGKTKLAAQIYAFVFELSAPDLTKPIFFRNTSLYVDPYDRACVPSMVGGYFEKTELDIFEQLVGDCAVFFDVGANIGVYSVIGCLRSDRLKSYAFEPVSENQALLRKNVASHQLEHRISVQPIAVSATSGTAVIHLYHSGTHSIDNDIGTNVREIDTISLDEFTAQEGVAPDIMKVDVEGHEAAVIDGALRMLARDTPTVFMEYIPSAHRNVEGLVERIPSLFSVCFTIDEVTRTVREIAPSELDRQKGYNLILTANPRHAEEIRRFGTT